MSTAGGAGGRHARGEADGQQMGCCGGRACPGNEVRGSAGLEGVRRVAARAGLCHCQTARSRVLGRWYSSPFDDLASLLPSTVLLNHKGKRRGRSWGQRAGHTGFGISAGSWLRSTLDARCNVQGLSLTSRRLACGTKDGMPRATRQLPEARQQHARDGSGAKCGKRTHSEVSHRTLQGESKYKRGPQKYAFCPIHFMGYRYSPFPLQLVHEEVLKPRPLGGLTPIPRPSMT